MSDPLITRTSNNFNLLRLLAAFGVIITHSYTLLGFAEKDLLTKMTNGLLSFSRLGVYVFFVISGFLVANSLWNSKNTASFFWKRFLRIFPALFVVLFLKAALDIKGQIDAKRDEERQSIAKELVDTFGPRANK